MKKTGLTVKEVELQTGIKRSRASDRSEAILEISDRNCKSYRCLIDVL